MGEAARDLARDALRRAGSSRMDSVAYDTGFVARLGALLPGDRLVAGALSYLRATQSAEGWWGSSRPSLHDRVLSTLSAACGLAAAGDPGDRAALDRAAAYVGGALPRLKGDRQLVGSDLLIPPLIERAQQAGLEFDAGASPYRGVGRLATSLYGRVFYSGHPVGHLLEILGDRIDAKRALSALGTGPSGSIMCAPSTTAFALEQAGRAQARAVAYLRSTANPDGGQRHFGPFEVMEIGYCLYALRHTPLFSLPEAGTPLRVLREAWMPGGVGFSREFPARDLDDTVVAALVIAASGEPVAPDFLDEFLADDYFLCYLEDRRGAVAPNLHAVEALRVLGHPEEDLLTEVALGFLRDLQLPTGAFVDHYSLSPFYPTWHAVEALTGTDDLRSERCARFLASCQRDDGAFEEGGVAPSAEGTAYALLGLAAWARHHPGEFADELERGAAWLLAHAGDPPSAEWVAKVLYAPVTMARAAVAGALAACAEARTHEASASLSPRAVAPFAGPAVGARPETAWTPLQRVDAKPRGA
jgi:hypothetical protein